MLTQNVLIESQSARTSFLSSRTDNQSLECLNKAKAVIMATWKGTGYGTTEQVAEYYNCPVTTVYEHLQNHKDEFANEIKNVTGEELRELKRDYRFSSFIGSNAPHFKLITPRGMHRLGFMLRDSEVAKHVRNVTLDVVEAVPNVVVEVESDFIKSCKELKQMQDVLGISSDHPSYQKVFDAIVAQRFGIEASAPIPKAKPVVKSEPKVKVEATIINSEASAIPSLREALPTAHCVIARVKTIVQVIEKPVVSQSDEPVTLGKLTKWGNKIRNLCKADKQPYEDILETMAVLGYLENIGVNCRGAINYRLVKIPKNSDIAQIARAVIA